MVKPRFQAGLGTEFKRAYKAGSNISSILLAQVIKVNYKYNSVELMLLRHKEVLQNSYITEGKFSAKLPMEFGGRNSYGKPYGEINPVQVGTVVLVGFIEQDKSQPVVLGVYPDNDIRSKLSRTPFNSVEPTDKELQSIMNQRFKVFPSLTYENMDGNGNRTVSFTGKSFMVMSANVTGMSDISDDGDGTAYENLGSSYYNDGELIEPVEGRAPEVLFKHQSTQDDHVYMFSIKQDGTFRTSQLNKKEDWRTYFEMNNLGEVCLKKQFDTKIIGQSLKESSLGITKGGVVYLKNGEMDLEVREDGLYSKGKPLGSGGSGEIGEELRKILEKLQGMLEDLEQGLGLVSAKVEEIDGTLTTHTAELKIQADLISQKVSKEEVQIEIDEALVNATGGKNLYVISTQLNAELKDDGTTAPSVRSNTSDYIEVEKKVFYTSTVFNNSVDNVLRIVWYNKKKEFISTNFVEGKTKLFLPEEAPEEAVYLRVGILYKADTKMMVERGKTSTEYALASEDLMSGINDAKQDAENAKQDAENAQNSANEAKKEAENANTWINDTASDSKLTAFEKIGVLKEWEAIVKEQPLITAQAKKYEVSSEEYISRFEILRAYTNIILANMSETTEITGTEFRDKFNNYYTEKTKLLGEISIKAQSNLEDAQKDLETEIAKKESSVIKQPTEPLNPASNIFWLDTSKDPNILKRWDEPTKKWVKATPTEASEVGAFNEVDGEKLAHRVTEAESKITPEAITNTVTGSTDYRDTIQKLNDIIDTGLGNVNGRIDDIDLTPYVTNTELKQTMEDFNFLVQSTGGVNKIQNSIGMAGTDFWNDAINVETTSNISGVDFPSGFHLINNTAILEMSQVVPITKLSTYTLSFYMKLNKNVKGGIKVVIDGEEKLFVGTDTVTFGYVKYEATFTSNSNTTLVISGGVGSDMIITGLMLNIGNIALTWQNYPSELYSTNVLIDLNGLRVYSNRSSNYTKITPDEFSGYAEVDGEVQRIFTLNEDVTEVKKLSAEKELKLPPFKIITLENSLNNGWAIVKV